MAHREISDASVEDDTMGSLVDEFVHRCLPMNGFSLNSQSSFHLWAVVAFALLLRSIEVPADGPVSAPDPIALVDLVEFLDLHDLVENLPKTLCVGKSAVVLAFVTFD